MDGKGHRMFAPIFSFCGAQLLLNYGLISPTLGQTGIAVTCGVATISAMLPDADLYAAYPTVAILDAMPMKKKNGAYHFRTNNGVKQYRPPKNKIVAMMALFWKSIGVRKHRDWRTHAPTIHIPLGLLLIKLTNVLQLSGNLAPYTALAQSILLGIVLGYWSHIVADFPNKGGIPLGPSNKQYSISRRLLGNRFSNIFKSSSKFYVSLMMAIFIDLAFFLVNKDAALKVNMLALNTVTTILKSVLNVIMKSLNRLVG